MENEPLLKTSDVATMASVSQSTVTKWVQTGKLHPKIVTPGGHYRFTKEAVDELLKQQ